jgi:hypothetical protein
MEEEERILDVPHTLKSPSSFIVVILSSLRHRSCVRCHYPIHSLEESYNHWTTALEKNDWRIHNGRKRK